MGIPKKPTRQQKEHTKNTPLKKPDGTYAQNTTQTMDQWTQWIKTNFQVPTEKEHPETCHIKEEQWREIQKILCNQSTPSQSQETTQTYIKTPQDLQNSRKMSPIQNAIQNNPQIQKWLTGEYTEQDIRPTIKQLKQQSAWNGRNTRGGI